MFTKNALGYSSYLFFRSAARDKSAFSHPILSNAIGKADRWFKFLLLSMTFQPLSQDVRTRQCASRSPPAKPQGRQEKRSDQSLKPSKQESNGIDQNSKRPSKEPHQRQANCLQYRPHDPSDGTSVHPKANQTHHNGTPAKLSIVGTI
jgi:hypothetical protein